METIRIKRMRENAKLPEFKNGNWMDTYVSMIGCVDQDKLDEGGEFTFDDVIWYPNGLTYSEGDVILLKLGFAIELPKGKELHLLPRSGAFRKHGVILTNGEGIGDDTYIGDQDEYSALMYAVREGRIEPGERIIQIKIEDAMPQYQFEEVEHLGNPDRGGYGSTGR